VRRHGRAQHAGRRGASPAARDRRRPERVQPRRASPGGRELDGGSGGLSQRHRPSSGVPEAWNELGFALRNQARYAEALDAYAEALRLRPSFPEALEYLGEAYVKMGRLDEARRVLDRLRPLDSGRAQELAEVIEKGK